MRRIAGLLEQRPHDRQADRLTLSMQEIAAGRCAEHILSSSPFLFPAIRRFPKSRQGGVARGAHMRRGPRRSYCRCSEAAVIASARWPTRIEKGFQHMRLRKQPKQQRQVVRPGAPRPAEPAGDPTLPGSAGYRGAERLGKNAMPVSRFNFKRPDGKA